ncbi:hypothetical protein W97_08149 [Coniosporium apollinis CBS 100218]|uniref:3-oxo-5-alpha-steroid 4-dehydrogenase C-terminal domain-containing protein n=1 Tax=Coniosporium apollinis (strain CBS 100218) TaxID=1168221 RepID=R7Z4L9_CONA1|nr:uncharacterized protein W97_08149 [Coniosporium apollinis CBS 100218]EON68891.1 hypothetical protein W97_08149 [Coniosporium apollinis CBS 100218]
MALIQNWLPPSRENWELIAWGWQFFPLFTAIQWLNSYYPAGKTSINSRLNLPGKWAWATMEAPGFLTLLYIMWSLPQELGLERLPWENWIMAALFTTHYLYRALLYPYLALSLSPIHISVWALAVAWQLLNALSLGGWLGGHGPTTTYDWAGKLYAIQFGMIVWVWGFLGNIFHDDDLREIRRAAGRRQAKAARQQGQRKGKNGKAEGVDKVYMMPKNGLFRWVLYPHYLCEWIEWAGFWIVGGWGCMPARSFLVNEIATMTPRAVQGWHWYVERFGREEVGGRKAVIPGIL